MAGTVQVPFGNTFVQRIAPAMPAQAYKTYGMSFPRKSHWRPASCEEVTCLAYLNGWKTILPLDSEHVDVVRGLRGKYSFTEEGPDEAGLLTFDFPPGQPCFKSSTHRVRLERVPVLYVANGDWRGTYGRRVHANALDWVDDFAGHQDKLATALQRG